jgi:transcriptional regulator with XRE-family HTH domain
MKDIRMIIANNISTLRTDEGMTQLKLAEVLNYSDKAVSKWERGEALPDVVVLKAIADYFGVTVDYLLTDDHNGETTSRTAAKQRRKNRIVMSLVSILLVWVVATLAFATLAVLSLPVPAYLVFIYAIPASLVLLLIFNCVWGRKKYNYFIVSALMWTAVLSVHLTVLSFGLNLWILFVAAAPMQLIFLFVPGISLIRYGRVKKDGE